MASDGASDDDRVGSTETGAGLNDSGFMVAGKKQGGDAARIFGRNLTMVILFIETSP